jgi:hypothetical protein
VNDEVHKLESEPAILVSDYSNILKEIGLYAEI